MTPLPQAVRDDLAARLWGGLLQQGLAEGLDQIRLEHRHATELSFCALSEGAWQPLTVETSATLAPAIVQHLKDLAGLRSVGHFQPQQGVARYRVGDRDLEFPIEVRTLGSGIERITIHLPATAKSGQ